MSTATILEMPQIVSRCEPTPQQKAAGHIAQAWAELRYIEGREALEIRATLRALVSRVESIK